MKKTNSWIQPTINFNPLHRVFRRSGREISGRLTFAVLCISAASVLLQTKHASAATPIKVKSDELNTLTFSELVIQFENDADIGVAKDGYKLLIFNELRAHGYNVMGAESLVFGEDKSDRARFVLGGTLTEFECESGFIRKCRIAIEWQLLDRKKGEVVYKVLTRALEDQ